MIKLITISVLGYILYRLFLVPRALNSPTNNAQNTPSPGANEDGDFVEYEEVE